MAINTHGFPNTTDRTSYQYEDDYADVWEALKVPWNWIRFLDMVPEGKPVRNPEFYWMEDITKVRTVQVNGAVADTTTEAITLDTGQAAYLQPGDILISHNAAGVTEQLQVLTTDDAQGITATRGYGGSTAHNIADDQVFRIMRLREEASEADDFEYKGDVRRTNYTGIISRSIKLSGSAMEGKPRGYQTAELDRQEAEILLSLKGELEDLLLFGPGAARATAEYGVPLGVRDSINALAGSNIGASAVTWGFKQLNSRVNWLAEQGMVNDSSNLICLCTSSMASAAGFWGAGACTRQASDRTYGFEVNTVHSTLGLDIPLVWSYRQQPDEYMLLDLSRISIHPLGNRKLKRMVKPAGIDLNDYEARRLLMEWGVRVRYADKAHYLQKLVTVA